MRIAMCDLRLEQLAVVYPGDRRYEIAERVFAVPLIELATGDVITLFPRAHRSRKSRSATAWPAS
jgi:hypothetical protein